LGDRDESRSKRFVLSCRGLSLPIIHPLREEGGEIDVAGDDRLGVDQNRRRIFAG